MNRWFIKITPRVISEGLIAIGVLWLILSVFLLDYSVERAKDIMDSEMWIDRKIRNGLIYMMVLLLLEAWNIYSYFRRKYSFAIVIGIAAFVWTYIFFRLAEKMPPF